MEPADLLFYISALCTGLAKAGMSALGNIVTPLFTTVLEDPKEAAAMGTLIFFIGDIGAIIWYRSAANIRILLKVLPLAMIGMTIAFIFGRSLAAPLYMAVITTLSGLALIPLFQVLWHKLKKQVPPEHGLPHGIESSEKVLPTHKTLRHYVVLYSCGILAGIGTTMGNAAGIFMNLYLSELKVGKREFVATSAWYYFCVNAIKIVAHIFYWQTLTESALKNVLKLAVFVVIGLAVGVYLIRIMDERVFTWLIVLASMFSFGILLQRTLSLYHLI